MSEYEFIGSVIFWRHQDNTKVRIIVYIFELLTALKSMIIKNLFKEELGSFLKRL